MSIKDTTVQNSSASSHEDTLEAQSPTDIRGGTILRDVDIDGDDHWRVTHVSEGGVTAINLTTNDVRRWPHDELVEYMSHDWHYKIRIAA